MPIKASLVGSDLFIVDLSDGEWEAREYLQDGCQISRAINIAFDYFEIGSLPGTDGTACHYLESH